MLKLYKEIDEICTKFDIEYCAAGGTMIGAIRHRGFIPWDDDMDIYMTLKNWRKFMAACSQDGVLPPDRVLACQENDRSYHNVIGRYTDLSMTTIHKNQVLHDDQAGFVIDIDKKEASESIGCLTFFNNFKISLWFLITILQHARLLIRILYTCILT